MSSGWLIRSVGYVVSRDVGLVGGSPLASIVTPSPVATISRQPSRSAYEVSSNAIVVRSSMGAASVATYAHSIRIVERPPSPAGKEIAAPEGSSVAAAPSTVNRNPSAWAAQAGSRAASVSWSVTSPSPSASIRWRSSNVGISAMSMTMSRRISSAETAIPA